VRRDDCRVGRFTFHEFVGDGAGSVVDRHAIAGVGQVQSEVGAHDGEADDAYVGFVGHVERLLPIEPLSLHRP
jgi:hypothetical protein